MPGHIEHQRGIAIVGDRSGLHHVESAIAEQLRRPAGDPDARLRLCLTPGMAEMIGTAGPIEGAAP